MESENKQKGFLTNNQDPAAIQNTEWKNVLPADVYHIAREKGTERPGTGKYYHHDEVGTYHCAVCGNPLFRSNGKFNSSCGWPSFFFFFLKESLIFHKLFFAPGFIFRINVVYIRLSYRRPLNLN